MTQHSKDEFDNVRAALRLGHAACANDQRYASLNVIDEALRILDSLQAKAAQVSDEPVYQMKSINGDGHWRDCSKATYDSLLSYSIYERRILYPRPQPNPADSNHVTNKEDFKMNIEVTSEMIKTFHSAVRGEVTLTEGDEADIEIGLRAVFASLEPADAVVPDARAIRDKVYDDLMKRFSQSDRQKIANLFVHDCSISALSIKDRYDSHRGDFVAAPQKPQGVKS